MIGFILAILFTAALGVGAALAFGLALGGDDDAA